MTIKPQKNVDEMSTITISFGVLSRPINLQLKESGFMIEKDYIYQECADSINKIKVILSLPDYIVKDLRQKLVKKILKNMVPIDENKTLIKAVIEK